MRSRGDRDGGGEAFQPIANAGRNVDRLGHLAKHFTCPVAKMAFEHVQVIGRIGQQCIAGRRIQLRTEHFHLRADSLFLQRDQFATFRFDQFPRHKSATQLVPRIELKHRIGPHKYADGSVRSKTDNKGFGIPRQFDFDPLDQSSRFEEDVFAILFFSSHTFD